MWIFAIVRNQILYRTFLHITHCYGRSLSGLLFDNQKQNVGNECTLLSYIFLQHNFLYNVHLLSKF
jgi:hypothetical protein